MRRRPVLPFAVVVPLALVACTSDDPAATPTTVAPPSSAPASTMAATTASAAAESTDPAALREELLEMLVQDQAVRTGVAPPGDDRTTDELFAAMDAVDEHNQARLAEIFNEHGWPGWSLVGEDGSTAAWAIVQHADLDLAFQERGMALLTEAVAAGDASAGDLAYLTDRVLVAKGEPQEYGTQWGGVDADGNPMPSTPIRDEANVDARRAEAGLSTLAEYLEELTTAFGG